MTDYKVALGARIDDEGDLLLTFAEPAPVAILNCGRAAEVARKLEAFGALAEAARHAIFDIHTHSDFQEPKAELLAALEAAGVSTRWRPPQIGGPDR